MAIWTVKYRDIMVDGTSGWHWEAYFLNDPKPQKTFDYGGEDWIRSALSRKHIRADMQQGDLVVCYQTDDKSVMGLTQLASNGYEDPEYGGFSMFDLIPSQDALSWCGNPLSIKTMREYECSPACFGRGTQGSVFPMSVDEFEHMLRVFIEEQNYINFGMLARWLRKCGQGAIADTIESSS